MASAPRAVPKASSRAAKSAKSENINITRSPKESPPTIKKKLCRLVNGSVSPTSSVNFGDLSSEMKGKKSSPIPIRSNSILKKMPSRDSPDSTNDSPASARRVQFKQHVTVFLMSDDGDIVCSGCQKLNNTTENTRPSSRLSKSSQNGRVLEKCDLKVTDDVVDSSEVDFTFIEDANRGTILKFVIPLGHDYKPDDIVVKANVSGSRIRLVATKPVSYPDGSIRMEQSSKRFMLPMDVDPYMVTARLDVKGQLTVEAPVLTLATRDKLKRTSVALSDISNQAKGAA